MCFVTLFLIMALSLDAMQVLLCFVAFCVCVLSCSTWQWHLMRVFHMWLCKCWTSPMLFLLDGLTMFRLAKTSQQGPGNTGKRRALRTRYYSNSDIQREMLLKSFFCDIKPTGAPKDRSSNRDSSKAGWQQRGWNIRFCLHRCRQGFGQLWIMAKMTLYTW